MFYNMYSIANISRKVLGIRVNLNTCETHVNGETQFQYKYAWMWKCFNQEKRVADSKICGYKQTGVVMKAKMHIYSDLYTKSSEQKNVCTHDFKILLN